MIRDIIRFYRESVQLLDTGDRDLTLGDYLHQNRYSTEFVEYHILPMGSAIWSSGSEQIQNFPARHFVEFFHNHGFLRLRNRPAWRTIEGGSSQYVERLIIGFRDRIRLKCPVVSITRRPDSVEITCSNGEIEKFDHVVIATHSDQALGLLTDAHPRETEILSQIKYNSNETVLHSDSSLLPLSRRAWASWNYYIRRDQPDHPIVTYYMNSLQDIHSSVHFCVTLNSTDSVEPDLIIKRMTYHHPVYNPRAVRAQQRWAEISGRNRTHFCGAYWGYGFHEDGVRSALRVCETFGRRL